MDKIDSIYIGADSLITALGDKVSTVDAMYSGVSGLTFNQEYGMYLGIIDRTHDSACVHDGYTFFESLIINQLKNVFSSSCMDVREESLLVIISTTKGNVDKLQDSLSLLSDDVYLYVSAEKISKYFGFANPPIVLSNACISGVSALVVARELILEGKYSHAVVVGCDVLSHFITEGFASFKSISATPCRPYDSERDGLTLGEACGAILLTTEQKYASKPYVRLAGGTITNDANHISGPSRTGDGLFYAIDNAINESGLSKDDIAFVNAHGTATVYNDEMESKAIDWAELSNVPVNSLKGYIGHTLGASGVVESILSIHELREGIVYGTAGFRLLGTSKEIKVSSSSSEIFKKSCVKTASGFGGCNAAVVFTMQDISLCKPGYSDVEELISYELPYSESPFHEFIRAEYKKFGESNMKFYKMSDLCKAAYVGTMNLLSGVSLLDNLNDKNVSVILSNKSSSLEADIEHQVILNEKNPEGASPAVFVYTLPNVAIGELCIRHKIRGNNTFFIENTYSGLCEEYGRLLIKNGKTDYVICGWCEKLGESYSVKLKLLKKAGI